MTKKSVPVFPIKAQGSLRHLGWDISTQWAIDATGQCWMDGAHGGPVEKVTPEQLIAEARDEGEVKQEMFRNLLGLPHPEPSWMALARAAGWVPPKVPEPTKAPKPDSTREHLVAFGKDALVTTSGMECLLECYDDHIAAGDEPSVAAHSALEAYGWLYEMAEYESRKGSA